MSEKQYYSFRNKTNNLSGKVDLSTLKKLFFNVYVMLEDKGYFRENFDSYIGATIYHQLRKENLYPFSYNKEYSEDDLFDIIEFCYNHVSISTGETGYTDSGEIEIFDSEIARKEYREKINDILKDYQNGFELSEDGQILKVEDFGFDTLLSAELPTSNDEIHKKIERAVFKFKSFKSSVTDMKDAVKELADILEYLRPKAIEVLDKKDDAFLFEIANKFSIRHYNKLQKNEYDKPKWLRWIFYHYLATIHLVLRSIDNL